MPAQDHARRSVQVTVRNRARWLSQNERILAPSRSVGRFPGWDKREKGEDMPKKRTRETIFTIGVVVGATLAAAAARAEDGVPQSGRMILAQQQLTPEEEQRRRQQQRQQRREQGGDQQQQQLQRPQHNQGGQNERQRSQGQDNRQIQQGQQPGQDDRQRRRERVQDNQNQQQEQLRQKRDDDRRKAEQERLKRDAEERQRREQADRAREKAKADQERAQQERQRQIEQDRAKKDAERNQLQQKRDQATDRNKRDNDQDRLKKDADRGERLRRDQATQPGQPDGDRKQAGPDDRRERARERVEKRREAVKNRFEEKTISSQEREERRKARREFTKENLKDIAKERKERRDANGRVIIEEPDRRRIVRFNNKVIIQHDETERLRGGYRDVRQERGPNGRTQTIIVRGGGVKIINITDNDGRLVRRVKVLPDGRQFVLINNEYRSGRRHRNYDDDRGGFGFYVDLPDFEIGIPEREYYVELDEADENEIEDVLTAEPLGDLESDYTLDEIRYSPDIRKHLRKLNVNNVNFEFGSWEIRADQIDKLAVVARVIKRIVEDNPEEVFLIAGHTDAVGSDEDNLSLSDRRAEAVARVLTDEFGVPPENLVTQGYGETELLVATSGPEVRNRRVDFMRITSALAQKE
jgi:outer membrane protein OmpA-like peptidoglycan-associated protein